MLKGRRAAWPRTRGCEAGREGRVALKRALAALEENEEEAVAEVRFAVG